MGGGVMIFPKFSALMMILLNGEVRGRKKQVTFNLTAGLHKFCWNVENLLVGLSVRFHVFVVYNFFFIFHSLLLPFF